MNLSRSLLDSGQIYVIFNTFHIFLWIGKDADPYFVYDLFGTDDQSRLDSFEWNEERIFYGDENLEKKWV